MRPPSRLGRPVPPPKQPTFSSRRRMRAHSTIDAHATFPTRFAPLERDLRAIFGDRLQSLVVYGARRRGRRSHRPTLAVVDGLIAPTTCAPAPDGSAAWHDAGLGTPLLLAAHEFERSLDAFPFEFGAILADHVVVSGRDPFDGPARRPGRPAARVRSAGAQPPAAPARGLSRDARPRRRARRSDRCDRRAPLAALRQSVARLEGTAAVGDAAAAIVERDARRAGRQPGAHRAHQRPHGAVVRRGAAAVSRVSRRRRAPHARTSIAGARRDAARSRRERVVARPSSLVACLIALACCVRLQPRRCARRRRCPS